MERSSGASRRSFFCDQRGGNVAKGASSRSRSGRQHAAKRSTAGHAQAKKSAPKRSGGPRSKAAAKRPARRKGVAPASARKKTAARAAAARSTRKTRVAKPSRVASVATTVRGAVAGAVAAVTKRLPWSSNDQDAITLLEKDHRRFEALLEQGETTTERAVKGRTELLNTLTTELNLHELVEEKILYPALKAHPEARDIVLEGYQEHHIADVLTRELLQLPPGDEQWGAKFKVLKESLEHHIEEEEREMFVKARGIFNRDQLLRLGSEIARMKAESRS